MAYQFQDDTANEIYRFELEKAHKLYDNDNRGDTLKAINIMLEMRMQPSLNLYRRAWMNILLGAACMDVDMERYDVKKFFDEAIRIAGEMRRRDENNGDRNEEDIKAIEDCANENLKEVKIIETEMIVEGKHVYPPFVPIIDLPWLREPNSGLNRSRSKQIEGTAYMLTKPKDGQQIFPRVMSLQEALAMGAGTPPSVGFGSKVEPSSHPITDFRQYKAVKEMIVPFGDRRTETGQTLQESPDSAFSSIPPTAQSTQAGISPTAQYELITNSDPVIPSALATEGQSETPAQPSTPLSSMSGVLTDDNKAIALNIVEKLRKVDIRERLPLLQLITTNLLDNTCEELPGNTDVLSTALQPILAVVLDGMQKQVLKATASPRATRKTAEKLGDSPTRAEKGVSDEDGTVEEESDGDWEKIAASDLEEQGDSDWENVGGKA